MEKTQSPIQQVIHTLEALGLKVKFIPANQNLPCDTAVTTLGLDEYNKAILLQVQQLSQTLENVLVQDEDNQESKQNISFILISFLATVPIKIPPEKTGDILQLIALSNKSLPFGFLNYSEIENAVYYTYTMPLLDQDLTEKTIVTILNAILYAKEMCFPLIHEVAVGHETFASLTEEQE